MDNNALSNTALLHLILISGLILIHHLLLYCDYLRILLRSAVFAAAQKFYLTHLISHKGVSYLEC